jgi:hypothetical protein
MCCQTRQIRHGSQGVRVDFQGEFLLRQLSKRNPDSHHNSLSIASVKYLCVVDRLGRLPIPLPVYVRSRPQSARQDLPLNTTKVQNAWFESAGDQHIVAGKVCQYTTDGRGNARPRPCSVVTLGSTRSMSCISVRLTVSLTPAALVLESAPQKGIKASD